MRRFRFGGALGLRLHRFACLEQATLRGIQQVIGGPLLRLECAQWNRAPPRAARPASAALPRPIRRSVAICSCFRRMRSMASAPLATCSSKPTLDFSSRCSSPCKEEMADSAVAMTTSSETISLAQPLHDGGVLGSLRSRSSLISRRVVRIPRASARVPPSMTWAPRNTSPSSVTIGPPDVSAACRAVSKSRAMPVETTAARMASAAGPLTRTTSRRGVNDDDRRRPVRHRARPAARRPVRRPGRGTQRAAGPRVAVDLPSGLNGSRPGRSAPHPGRSDRDLLRAQGRPHARARGRRRRRAERRRPGASRG